MSDFKHQPGSGTLFVNTSTNPKAPKLSGQFTALDGQVLEIALWTATDQNGKPKTDKNGSRFFSVKISEPRMTAPAKRQPQPDDDEIPF